MFQMDIVDRGSSVDRMVGGGVEASGSAWDSGAVMCGRDEPRPKPGVTTHLYLYAGDESLLPRKKISWYGRKAMAVYALAGLAFAGATLLLGGGRPTSDDEDQNSGRQPVLVRTTAKELRSVNGVRPLMHEEQSASIDRVAGIYGVALARVLDRNTRFPLSGLLSGVTLQRDIDRWRGAVEVHKTDDGRVMIVGYVDQGAAARLMGATGSVGSLFLYHKPERGDQMAVAIPAARIVDWNYRSPHEFSEIKVE